jgi:hypothetical protein
MYVVPTIEEFKALVAEVAVLRRELEQLKKSDMILDEVPVSVAARMLQRSEDTVRRLIAEGKLAFRRESEFGPYMISVESIRALKAKKRIG